MSTAALIERPAVIDAAIVERVLIHGDLRQLNPAQKVSYYNHVCESIGLNPLTKPFEYIVLNGKETLYAKRDATDQLRKIHNVSVQIVAREVTEDCYVVTARATLPTNRQDESIGAVPIAALRGEARANAMMKCETKAKRRVTLSICGLGMLDETEIDSIPHSAPAVVTGYTSSSGGTIPSKPNGGDSDSRPSGAELSLDAAPSSDTIIDRETGEELATPPAGYHYVVNYTLKNGWHEATLVQWDAQGGPLHVSTKTKEGEKLAQAANFHLPIRAEVKMKPTPGEAYLNKAEIFKAPKPGPVAGSDIAF